ncbi:hypothetical protein F4604DRAFT_1797086 [Suillus subluteus]|nr:hypothetical protein F4604DRAFT_1797086 [Suillus subluteus]
MSGSVLNTSVPSETVHDGLIPSSAAADFRLLLAKLPLEGNVLGFRDTAPVSKLSQLASHVWLSDTTVNMMLDIIRQPISTNLYLSSHHDIVLCYTATKIQSVYGLRDNIDYPNSKDCGELPRLGSDLAGGLKDSISTLCLINGNHWVAIVVNQREKKVFYGDPGGSGAPVVLRQAVDWWLKNHFTESFAWVRLPCTHQHDSHSCDIARITFGHQIVNKHLSAVCSLEFTEIPFA